MSYLRCLPCALFGVLISGCVERTLVVNSQPQGALVYFNDQEIGRTPLTREFTWYGTYDVALRMDGYETLKTRSNVIAPAWQWVPLDLIAEMLPFHLRDTHALTYTLKPSSERDVDPSRIMRRGLRLQQDLQSGENDPKVKGKKATR
jgi:hypothetical protein